MSCSLAAPNKDVFAALNSVRRLDCDRVPMNCAVNLCMGRHC
jgi:hypothetical protein